MIKAGLIGCGKISANHISAFEELQDAKIVAVCDLIEENLSVAIQKTGAKAYKDYREMLSKEKLDLAVITLPHSLHCEATCVAAEFGVNVFLEKPMGISVSECEKMIEICRRNNVMLWVGDPQRYHGGNIVAKELINSGEYGSLIAISETRCTNYFSESRPKWFLNKKTSGGGILMNLGAHTIDRIKYLTDSEICEVHGKIHIRDGYDVEDTAQVFGVTENGVSVTMNLSGNAESGHYATYLYLTGGEIRITSYCSRVSACKADGVFEDFDVPQTPVMKAQIADVIRTLKSGEKPIVSGEYGKEIIRVIESIYDMNA
ncbi:MAG: Gfo/Idh/MocA family oxidoreductase [Oscillospiraceae bacterium]|nr:Gfo/Idh/MocA family oxidoreductase [Oscillospiraceae bacterium]